MQTSLVRSMNILSGPTGIETYAQHTAVARHTSGCMTYMAAAQQTWWLHDIHGSCMTYMVVAQHTWRLHDINGGCTTYLADTKINPFPNTILIDITLDITI